MRPLPISRPHTPAAPSAALCQRARRGTAAVIPLLVALSGAWILASGGWRPALSRPAIAGPTDAEAGLRLAPQGTPFFFEIIESLDAGYLGDTPSHTGRDGGLEFRPNVALGDPVFRGTVGREGERPRRIGTVTRVVWERVSGGLSIEFDPEPLLRIAVGDEVWIDLNPLPPPVEASSVTPH